MTVASKVFVTCAVVAAATSSIGVYGLDPVMNSITQEQFKRFPSTFCSGVINGKMIGCTGSREGAKGVLTAIESEGELADFLSSGDAPPSSVLLIDSLFTKDNLDSIVAKEAVQAVYIKETGKSNVDPLSLRGINRATYGIPIMFLPVNFTEGVVDDAVAENKRIGLTAKQSNHLFVEGGTYMGPLDGTSEECFSKFACDPIGGYSVIGTVGAPHSDRDTVMVATPMDSDAMFKDYSFGANTAVSGLLTVLLAGTAFRDVRAEVAALPQQIVLSLFQGEQFDRMGSSKFLLDLEQGCRKYRNNETAESCFDPPTYSVAWEEMRNATISSVIVVEQVLGESLYVHNAAEALNADTNAVESKLVEVAAATPGVSLVAGVDTVPSTSTLNSFVPVMKGGVLISGSATGENAPEYNTHLDRFTGSEEELKAVAQRLAKLGEVVARSAIELAANGATVDFLDKVAVPQDTAEELAGCLLNRFACDLVASYLNVTTNALERLGGPVSMNSPDTPLPMYTGLYGLYRGERGFNAAIERFARMFLTEHISPELDSDIRCSDDGSCYYRLDCPTLLGSQYNTTGMCHLGYCTCSSVSLHDTYSIGLEVNEFNNGLRVIEGTDLPTWTEPVWGLSGTFVFRPIDVSAGIGLLVSGCLVGGLSWIGLKRLLRVENPKFKVL